MPSSGCDTKEMQFLPKKMQKFTARYACGKNNSFLSSFSISTVVVFCLSYCTHKKKKYYGLVHDDEAYIRDLC